STIQCMNKGFMDMGESNFNGLWGWHGPLSILKLREWNVPRGLRRLYTLKESSTGGNWRNNISASLIEGSSDEMLIKEVNVNRTDGHTIAMNTGSSSITLASRMLVDGSRPENMQANQVEHVASSLNFSYCYILQNGSFVFTWIGYLTTLEVQELVERQLDVIKNSISEKELPDETYKEDRVALFRVQGSRPENMQAIQFKHVASSLNFSYCYILQNGSFVFTWIGYLTTLEVQELVERQLNVIKVEKLITFAIDPTIGIVKEAADKPRPPSPSRGDWQQVGANDIASEILQDELPLANRMEVAELRMLRWTCGKMMLDMINNGVYRAELEVETIINKMREGRLRWFGHHF
ncbi:villin 4, partial [Tanacetum coccineum]